MRALLLLLGSAHAFHVGPSLGATRAISARQPSVARPYALARCAPCQLAALPTRRDMLPVVAYGSLAGVTAVTFGALADQFTDAWMAPAFLAWTVALPVLLNGWALIKNGGPGVAESMGGHAADASLTKLARDAAIAVGVEPPEYVYEIPRREPNAFAASGFGTASSTVAVTSGLRGLLTPAELSAVLAHEMGHLKNRDVARNMHLIIAIAGLGGIYEAGRMVLDSEARGGRSSDDDDDDDDDEGGGGAMLGLGLMALGLGSQGVAQLIKLSASRGAELEADRAAAEAFGGKSLISALTKIDKAAARAPADLRDDKEGRKLAFAMISDGPSPEGDDAAKSKEGPAWWTSTTSRIGRALRTHPPTDERIAALEKGMENGDVPRVRGPF